jgi:hypothetical protein
MLLYQLISTDALNIFNHDICFRPDCTIFILQECADADVVRKTTVLKLPKFFELDNKTGEYHCHVPHSNLVKKIQGMQSLLRLYKILQILCQFCLQMINHTRLQQRIRQLLIQMKQLIFFQLPIKSEMYIFN